MNENIELDKNKYNDISSDIRKNLREEIDDDELYVMALNIIEKAKSSFETEESISEYIENQIMAYLRTKEKEER